MTGREMPDPIGEEYSEVWIGECAQEACVRPATVVVRDGFNLCALHALDFDAREEHDAATLALELLGPWRGQALAHGLGELAEELDAIKSRVSDRAVERRFLMRALDQVEAEADPERTRERMGEGTRREREGSGDDV